MQAKILRIGVGVVLLMAGYMAGVHTPSSIHAGMQVSVPAYYGKVVAGDSSSLWFEDTNGTMRQVTIPAGNTIFTIARQK